MVKYPYINGKVSLYTFGGCFYVVCLSLHVTRASSKSPIENAITPRAGSTRYGNEVNPHSLKVAQASSPQRYWLNWA